MTSQRARHAAGTVGRIVIRFTEDQMVSNKLYVGNLSFNTTPEAVETLFAAVGEVPEVAMPTDRQPANLAASPSSPWAIPR